MVKPATTQMGFALMAVLRDIEEIYVLTVIETILSSPLVHLNKNSLHDAQKCQVAATV